MGESNAVERSIDLGVLWLRAVIVGFMAFFLGLVGHVSANGLLPGPVILGVLLVFSVMACVPLVARPVKAPMMLFLMIGGQTGVHMVLTMTAGHVGDRIVSQTPRAIAPPSSAALPTVDGRRVGSLLEAYQPSAGTPAGSSSGAGLPIAHLIHDMSAHAPMMAAHLAAAAVVALWLAHGERLLWTLMALLGRRLVTVLVVPLGMAGCVRVSRVAFEHAPRPSWSRWLVRPASRRGPPLPA